jgi:hypothetical protein
MKQAKFDPVGDARRQREILEQIPEPDEVFRAAARAALVRARINPETIAVLDKAAARSAGRPKAK